MRPSSRIIAGHDTIGKQHRMCTNANSTTRLSMLVHISARLGKLREAMSVNDEQQANEQAETDARATSDDDAPEGVTVEKVAEIEAFLAVLADEPRDELLGRFDIDEERWGNARKIWTERIEDEVMRASAPGQRMSAEEKYPLSMRYSIAYSNAAERARDGGETDEHLEDLAPAGASLGSDRVLRLGSSHG
jgi:hypothetical protein